MPTAKDMEKYAQQTRDTMAYRLAALLLENDTISDSEYHELMFPTNGAIERAEEAMK